MSKFTYLSREFGYCDFEEIFTYLLKFLVSANFVIDTCLVNNQGNVEKYADCEF